MADPTPIPPITTTKPWYQSITIWAATAVAFLQMLPGAVAGIDQAIPALHLGTNPIVISVLSIIAAIVAIYGRLTTKSTIS